MFSKSLEALINEFIQFPGIGPKTAQRFIFYLLKKKNNLDNLCQKIEELKKIRTCRLCGNFTEKEICYICEDVRRDHSLICLVANAIDLEAIEKIGEYQGVYEVLGGVLDPARGAEPDDLNIEHFLNRLRGPDPPTKVGVPIEVGKNRERNKIREIIFALNPNLEGEATLIYLMDLIKRDSDISKEIKLTRLAKGLSSGLELEYADSLTLGEALKERKNLDRNT